MGCAVGGRASRSLRACVGAAWGSGSAREGRVAVRGGRRSSAGSELCGRRGMHRAACGRASGLRGRRKCSGRACRCAGASEGLRRGMGREVGGECIAQPAGVRRAAWGAEVLGKGVHRRCAGRAKSFGGERVVRTARIASRSRRACIGAAWGSGSARGGRVAVRGREQVFGGEWVVRSAGLTHIRRSSTRARVLLYIRPPCLRREIAAMGSKDAPCEHPSPAKAFAPAPSAFTLPLHRFPRPPQINRHPAAAVIHNGLSTEKLSTSLPAALCKTFSPSRLRTRIYNISFARRPLPGSVRTVVPPCPAPPCAGWGRAKAKADAPSRSAEPCRLCAESLCAKAEVHKANPAPARALSPRQLVYGRAPAR